MNEVKLRGYLKDCKYSHTINGIDYDKANLIIPNSHQNEDDIITLCFRHYSNKHQEGELVDVVGNIRSYSKKVSENKNKVNIYVFTHFDPPKEMTESDSVNEISLDGRICKLDHLRQHASGVDSLSFTLANNIIIPGGNKINNYIPVICWGKLAHELSNLNISDKLEIEGTLQSRSYKKFLDNGSIEIKVAHEVVIKDYKFI